MTDAALNESAIREQAAEWIVRLDDALDDAQRQAVQAACRAWCAQDERHARIFRQMQQMWQAAAQPAKPKRGGKTTAAAGLLALLVLCWLLPLQAWLADVRVAPGELRQVTLEDGSRLTLDSGASVDIRFDGQTRSVHLHAGRLLADVAKDPQGRSFRVVGRDGTATALGTRYIVDQQAADTAVSVLESSVAVASRARPDQPVVLQAGQTVRYTRAAPGRPETLAPAATDAAWANGQLIFNATPLPEVVAELARHRRGILTLRRADALAELRFTGMLPLQDSDAALRILARSLPVSVEQATPYVVWLAPEETRTQK
ncbi:DUF4880 domain-containing protein [Pseudothauera nasutitermitis]|uniref:DUF4880 domain-containing protein n=1 Tax=Pseudothauera nasutitermitis TaxID=2565930 RepID=A0A4S4B370_9RHOO|nr:FecR domain-containing protein [Pseudothauera nasutitermitis]THF67039.1 DUF4880 domain-containing protein [Pseudothauera nasutitermitis]